MTQAALVFEGIRFSYNGGAVLDGVDLAVPSGAVTALMGPSGCGKSTLVAIAAGLLVPASGTIRRAHGRIGIMFQDPLLLPWRTALDNVAFALKADSLDAGERRRKARRALETVGLTGGDTGKYPRQLSGGMRQRVALARALVIEPDLLLLDEPFNGLDAALAQQMLALVRSRVDGDGVAALVVTHDAREAARFAEKICLFSGVPARTVACQDLGSGAGTRTEAEIGAISETLLSAARTERAPA